MRKRRMGPGTRRRTKVDRFPTGGKKRILVVCCRTALYRFLTALPNDPFLSWYEFHAGNRSSSNSLRSVRLAATEIFCLCLLASFQSLLCDSFFNPSRLCSRFLPTPFDVVVGGGDGS